MSKGGRGSAKVAAGAGPAAAGGHPAVKLKDPRRRKSTLASRYNAKYGANSPQRRGSNARRRSAPALDAPGGRRRSTGNADAGPAAGARRRDSAGGRRGSSGDLAPVRRTGAERRDSASAAKRRGSASAAVVPPVDSRRARRERMERRKSAAALMQGGGTLVDPLKEPSNGRLPRPRELIRQASDSFRRRKSEISRNRKRMYEINKTRSQMLSCWDQVLYQFYPERYEEPIICEAGLAVGLTQRQLHKLRRQFEDIDVNQWGEITRQEFCEWMDETHHPFSDGLFKVVDLDQSNGLSFDEFVTCICEYALYTKEQILRFCFDLFDTDGSGQLEPDEFVAMAAKINNYQPVFPGNFMRAMQEFDQNQDNIIDFDEFRHINDHYPLAFFPAYRMQERIQQASLGERAWTKVLERLHRKQGLV